MLVTMEQVQLRGGQVRRGLGEPAGRLWSVGEAGSCSCTSRRSAGLSGPEAWPERRQGELGKPLRSRQHSDLAE